MSTAIATVAPLKQALALATAAGDIPALQDVAAMAAALQKGAKQRGLGIVAENEAAVLILRAEYAMGEAILAMQEAGKLRYRGSPAGSGLLGAADLFPSVTPKVAEYYLNTFRGLGSLDSQVFEQLLVEVGEKTERIAKADLYRLASQYGRMPAASTDAARREQPTGNTNYLLLRTGIYRLLGWQVDEDGVGHATKNELTALAEDQLTELKSLVESLASAFGAAVKERRSLKAVA